MKSHSSFRNKDGAAILGDVVINMAEANGSAAVALVYCAATLGRRAGNGLVAINQTAIYGEASCVTNSSAESVSGLVAIYLGTLVNS